MTTSSVRSPDADALGAGSLDWTQLGQMTESGLMTIGAHTHTHRDLRTASANVVNELGTSNDLIARHLGESPSHFAIHGDTGLRLLMFMWRESTSQLPWVLRWENSVRPVQASPTTYPAGRWEGLV